MQPFFIHQQGKDYLWHIDGYDKLSPFGMPIHGCVDGFSRRVIWLELGTTNRRPEQTCSYFLDAVSKLGLPHSIRVDAGTENRNIKIAQDYLSTGLPRLTPLNAVLVGSSNHNEVSFQQGWKCSDLFFMHIEKHYPGLIFDCPKNMKRTCIDTLYDIDTLSILTHSGTLNWHILSLKWLWELIKWWLHIFIIFKLGIFSNLGQV